MISVFWFCLSWNPFSVNVVSAKTWSQVLRPCLKPASTTTIVSSRVGLIRCRISRSMTTRTVMRLDDSWQQWNGLCLAWEQLWSLPDAMHEVSSSPEQFYWRKTWASSLPLDPCWSGTQHPHMGRTKAAYDQYSERRDSVEISSRKDAIMLAQLGSSHSNLVK